MTVPELAGRTTTIYRHIDRCGCLLYVGVTYDATQRSQAHASGSWWSKWTDRVQLEETVYADRAAALASEREIIRAESPTFNTVHATDKQRSVIHYLVTHGHWEHLSVASSVGAKQKPDLLRALDAAGRYETIAWTEEPLAHVVDWSDPLLRRFIEKTETDANGCWRWQAHITAKGYGSFRHPETNWAHRAAYLLFRGPVPAGHELRQRCDVKDCVNPAHLVALPRSVSRKRRISEIARTCSENHPDMPSRRVRRADGRAYCRECNRVRARSRKLVANG